MNNKVLLKNVTRRYGSDYALRNFSYNFPNSGVVAILGRSGSGKSTLLNIVSGMDRHFDGTAVVLGKSIKSMNQDELAEFRMKNIGYVFQSFNLIELETAFDNVYFSIDALYTEEPEKKRLKAMDLLRFVGLESKADQVVNTLSGGEKQRIAFARSLVADPKILLCDEPTASLDKGNAEKVFDIIRAIAKRRLVIVVTHDEELAFQFADKIIRISNGELQSDEDVQRLSDKKTMLPTLKMGPMKETPSLSSSFIFRHSRHLIKNRRIRSLISRASISAGLIGLGLSIYVATSISDEISHAFEAIIPENQVVVAKRLQPEQPISNIYSATQRQVEYLCRSYPDEISDWGTTISMDFESVFKDDDSFSLITGGKTITLASFHARHINDFLWLDDYPEMQVFPKRPEAMDMDDVIIGLPYSNMASLCFSLGIMRNYQELGAYISSHGMRMLQFLSNGDIGFYNEELFSIRGVVASDMPCFYHLNHRWNHEFFIDHLQFRSSLQEDTPNPQTVLEIPFIHFMGDMSSILDRCRKEEQTKTLIFEKASEAYLPSVCNAFTQCEFDRYYVYSCDRNGIEWGFMESLWDHPLAKGGLVCSSAGYFALSESFLQGFAMKFFISNDAEALFGVSESASSVAAELAARPIDLPDSVIDGSFGAGSSAFRVSANFSDLQSGRIPVGVDEVAISSALNAKMNKPSTLFVAAQVSESQIGNRVVREFVNVEVKVVGVVKSNRDGIFVNNSWTVDFFTDRLGMSPFNLEPTACIVCFDNKSDSVSFMDEMSKALPEYTFYSPSEDASNSVSETSGYIGGVLTVFSAIALIMSSLLFSIVMVITIGENDKEARLLHALGISAIDVARIYRGVSFHYALQSFLVASVSLLLCELLAKKYISDAFSVSFTLEISWMPFLVLAAFIGAFLVIMAAYVKRKALEKTAD